jgi:putative ABC transport system substrate-binding protein
MIRRESITLLGGAAAAWPLAARAQLPKQVPRIGVLLFGDEVESSGLVRAFKTGMAERGYQDARNVQFDVRYSDASAEKLTRNRNANCRPKITSAVPALQGRCCGRGTTT